MKTYALLVILWQQTGRIYGMWYIENNLNPKCDKHTISQWHRLKKKSKYFMVFLAKVQIIVKMCKTDTVTLKHRISPLLATPLSSKQDSLVWLLRRAASNFPSHHSHRNCPILAVISMTTRLIQSITRNNILLEQKFNSGESKAKNKREWPLPLRSRRRCYAFLNIIASTNKFS